MPVDIKVPVVGESVTEGRLIRWLKQDGDLVRQDDPLFELETDKATQEVAAQVSGALKITVREGETVAIGSVVGTIDESVSVPTAKTATKPGPDTSAVLKTIQPPPPPAVTADVAMSPAARRVAAEQGIDPTKVTGTGRGGVSTKEDALRQPSPPFVATSPAPTNGTMIVEQPASTRTTKQRMSPIRTRIAERLLQSQQTTASLTTFNETDMSAIMELRAKYKDKFKEKHQVGLGFMSFFVKAVVEALKTYPIVNARIDGPDVVQQHFYDIGVAVSTERGLMVPVVRDADKLTFANIESKITELAVKARDGKISVNDLTGGTFTITNGGIFGSMLSTPILNPPQCAILGMHSIQKRAVVVDDQIVIRPMMYLALTYDHRLVDGREAVLFLVRVKDCLENPERLMLGV